VTRVLLFGASGFLGRHIQAAFAADPRVDELTCPGRDRCDLLAPGTDQLEALLDELKPDVLVNCTGRLDGAAHQLVEANTVVTAKLLDAVADGRRAIRLIRLGSAGEYGPVPRGHAVAETDPAAPRRAYGVSHLAATRLVELSRVRGLVDGLTLRVFNPVGPGMPEQTMLGRAAAQLRAAQATGADSITLGPLSAFRDFVDVRDVATAVAAAALTQSVPDPVLNVGSGVAVTGRAAVRLLAEAAGFAGAIREDGRGADRSAAVDWMLADISRATAVLGWRPDHQLADSVKSIWADPVHRA
jgi:nucleoside-diphosphate-sugar epimerase